MSVGDGWIKGALGMLDQDWPETATESWGRDSELDEEPTLLHDSEPEGKTMSKHSQGGALTCCFQSYQ